MDKYLIIKNILPFCSQGCQALQARGSSKGRTHQKSYQYVGHWVLMSFDLLINRAMHLHSYDPCRMSAAQAAIVARALVSNFAGCDWDTQRWVCHTPASALQSNLVDCGVFAMVNAIAIMARFSVPPSLNATLWRIILLHACSDPSIPLAQLVPCPPTALAGIKHYIDLCTAAFDQAYLAIHFLDHYYTEIKLAMEPKAQERIALADNIKHVSCGLQTLRKITTSSTRLCAANQLMADELLDATKTTERIIEEQIQLETKASFVKVARNAAQAIALLLEQAIAAANARMPLVS
jgi:hypothetical protein